MKKIDEQRYLWLLRAFGIFTIISIILNVVLILSYQKINPTKKEEAFFITSATNNIDTLYVLRTSDLSILPESLGQKIAKNYIINYVVDRETIYKNPKLQRNIWGLTSNLFAFSSDNLYKEFYNSQQFKTGINNISETTTTATVNPDDVRFLNRLNVWEVIVKLKTINAQTGTQTQNIKQLQLQADFTKSPYKKTGTDMWKNPLDFKITEYEYIK